MKINRERLQQHLTILSGFGKDPLGGITRSIGSQSELEVRQWLIGRGKAMGATVVTDAIANIWIKKNMGKSTLKPITIGSHHDTVPNGGKYDGALGVLLGIEIMQTVLENKRCMKHPLQVVSFTAEEPNPYNISTMGSRSITGKISKEVLGKAVHSETGEPLSKAILTAGGNIPDLDKSQLKTNDMAAFIECHIEQGSNLYKQKKPVAVVSKITGIYRESITVTGEANHAGTTLMPDRHDALLAASEICLALEKTVAAVHRNDVTGTVGKLTVFPNAANIIPGTVTFILEVRTPDETIKKAVVNEISLTVGEIIKHRQVQVKREIILNQAPVEMSPVIINALKNTIEKNHNECISLVSMAGHDTVHMTGITDAGMLFVQSIGGKSHCADENTDMNDIEVAGNILLQAVLSLDETLE